MGKLWGTRFKKKSDPLADSFSFSIGYDFRLAKYDVIVSIAHAEMLAKQKIIPSADAQKIISGLKKIGKDIDQGKMKPDKKCEDVHTQIQSALKKMIGEPADRLHTARSRNDLVVMDMKLYCLVEYSRISDLITEMQKAIVKCAEKNKDVIIPAYTHLQAAQVVLFAHHLLAYVEMLERDKGRLMDTIKRTNSNVLGSGALSGSTLPIDREYVTEHLGLAVTTLNSIDSVSDRDFIMEGLAAISILGVHLSRMAEDLIIFTTEEFDRVEIDEAYCTGSSIMPHKQNPDMCELIRGEAATLIGNLNKILILVKGLPLTYNRDLQLDKPPLFESVEKSGEMLSLFGKIFQTLKVGKEQKSSLKATLTENENFYSVDMVEYLIQKGTSYREAHDTVGQIVKDASEKGIRISEMNEDVLRKYSSLFDGDVKKLFNPKMSVKMKKSLGSTNPAMVDGQIKEWKRKLHVGKKPSNRKKR